MLDSCALYFEAFLVVAVIYWIIFGALSFAQRGLETRLNRAFAR
ncbi:ABC-type amino acid transport system permease subunit [Limimaricola variabilis]|uniref:ABC-type amino acid transport system permease subunit n=1 Tax=Limimaricola variabilis TaxID=1492771 RepID=A0ABR6HS74_9RHOB|nr:ABC-type amino acid transport system permease subunit [Limimaricola variabilis]